MQIVLATKNMGKVKELEELLSDMGVDIQSLKEYPEMPDVVEDGVTFAENAIKKAKAVCKYTGLVALADDSGLEVDALNGQPGVYSARFAGEDKSDLDNNLKLLALLKDVPKEQRTARFKCVIAIVTPEGKIHTAEGTCEGLIGYDMIGDKGFGYDPLFYLPEYYKSFGQLELSLKNKISHRGRALEKAKEALVDVIQGG